MKILRFAKTLTALVLTLTVIMLLPLQTVSAAENNGKYVSEHLDEPIELDIQ